MIFRCGITGSGRKATCRNGSGSVQPSALRGAPKRDQLLAHRLERLEAHQPGDRQRQLGADLAACGDDEAALQLDDAVDRRRHVGIVDADHGDVVAVVADRGGDGAALQAEAMHEAAADVAVLAVARDDRDLDRVLRRDRPAPRRASAAMSRSSALGDDAPGGDADHRHAVRAAPGCGNRSAATGARFTLSRPTGGKRRARLEERVARPAARRRSRCATRHSSRSSSSTMSARQPGATRPRSRSPKAFAADQLAAR